MTPHRFCCSVAVATVNGVLVCVRHAVHFNCKDTVRGGQEYKMEKKEDRGEKNC